MNTVSSSGGAPAPAPAGLKMAIEYAPLIVFFLANFLVPGDAARTIVARFTSSLDTLQQMEALLIARVIVATAAFILASGVAMLYSRIRLGHISAMLWISGGLVVVFGALTMYFHDPRFIQMKPTIVYVMLAGVLAFGLKTGRPLLQELLGGTYPGLSQDGWRKLTVNWVWFFVVMAIGNEAVWRIARASMGSTRGWDAWAIYKVWIVIPLTLVFAIANVPMLIRNGLKLGGEAPLPPEG
ncbi:intracellular septation protein [Sphingomonas gellani]|uniref:Inner membrane-spanning protein YciB n=1 Tax=Sphingomonas gellani TaxID=1166340 RepID=A0A1H7YH97_9SPHN|nr:intracellular septation protein [Sphingomonas gellani]